MTVLPGTGIMQKVMGIKNVEEMWLLSTAWTPQIQEIQAYSLEMMSAWKTGALLCV